MPQKRSHPRLGSRGQPEESRTAILEAAAREFAEHGIAGARIDAIARNARVNKALLYYYFKDKEALYGAVLDDAFARMESAVLRGLESDLPLRNKVLAYVGAYFDFIASNQIHARLMQREMIRAGDHRSAHIENLSSTYFKRIYEDLRELLQRGIKHGVFRKVDTAYFILSVNAMIVFYFSSARAMKQVLRFDPLSQERIAEGRATILDFVSAALFPSRKTGRWSHIGRSEAAVHRARQAAANDF
jgi:TetR/AcrR family transcriptional regulator